MCSGCGCRLLSSDLAPSSVSWVLAPPGWKALLDAPGAAPAQEVLAWLLALGAWDS